MNSGPTDVPDVLRRLQQLLGTFQLEEGAVLVQLPQVPPRLISPDTVANRGYFAYPPQGLFYLAATFTGLKIPTRLVDLNFEVLSRVAAGPADPGTAWRMALNEALDAFVRPLLCISFMFDSTFEQLTDVCQFLRTARPGCCIAIGGVAATGDPQRLLTEDLADLVMVNEGEVTLERLYAVVRAEPTLAPVNLWFRDAEGRFQSLPSLTGGDVALDVRAELGKLPIPRYHRVGSLNNFSRMRGVEVPYATILSRRGCRAHCAFCAVRNFNGPGVRVREVEDVVEELVFWHERHGVQHFDWLDDDLLYDREDSIRLFRAIQARLPRITWAASNGLIAAVITRECMDAMQDSGCIGFTVGLETGNRELLRRIRKPGSLEKFRTFARIARDYPRMFLLANFILGLPGETFGQMLDSFRVAAEARLDWNNFFTFQPLKNTDAYLAYGRLAHDDLNLKLVGSTLNFNPARSETQYQRAEGTLSGFDVFSLPGDLVPDLAQRREIWFTFNYIINFLRMPALTTDQPRRLENAIRWLSALRQAFPENGAIDCVLAFLLHRKGDDRRSLERIRSEGRQKLSAHPFWERQDRAFGFSALLDFQLPDLDHTLSAEAATVPGVPEGSG